MGSGFWDEYLSVKHSVGNDICVWIIVLGPIFECGTVLLDRYLSVENSVGTDN